MAAITEQYKNTSSRIYLNHIRELIEIRRSTYIIQELAEEFESNNTMFLESLDRRIDKLTSEIEHCYDIVEQLAHETGTAGSMLYDHVRYDETYDAIARQYHYEISTVKKNVRKARVALYDKLPVEYQ